VSIKHLLTQPRLRLPQTSRLINARREHLRALRIETDLYVQHSTKWTGQLSKGFKMEWSYCTFKGGLLICLSKADEFVRRYTTKSGDAWPVRRLTSGYLPSFEASPLLHYRTKLYCLGTEAGVREWLVRGRYSAAHDLLIISL